MKRLPFLFLLLSCLFAELEAQSVCDFQKLLNDGKVAGKQEDYELALNKFNSARRCDPDKGEVIDKEVEKLFEAINRKKRLAETERQRAEEQQKIANLEKQRAEEQQKIAEQEKQRAEEQTKIARAARDSAVILLQKFEAASAEIVDALALEANNLIYRLDYNAAAAKLRTAADLNQPTDSFKKAVAEAAFFWNEAGHTTQAAGLLSAAKQTGVPGEKTRLQEWLKKYAGNTLYNALTQRYFPDMLPVSGGVTTFGDKKAPVSAFRMARTETTMWQYAVYYFSTRGKEMCTDSFLVSHLSWGLAGDNPAVYVSWYEAALYANWLSKHFNLDTVYIFQGANFKEINYNAKGYRLPTNVEWYYAACGGPVQKVFKYAGSDDLDSVGWYSNNSGSRTQPVAGKKANSLGLYDMSGSVSEWRGDWQGEFPDTFPANYHGPDSGKYRMNGGGSWFGPAVTCELAVSSSGGTHPSFRFHSIGFRLALRS